MSAAERLNASTLLDAQLEAGRADKPALTTAGGEITYRQLAGLTAAVASYLTVLGIEREQRVLMILDDSPAFPAAFLGAMRIGAVPVPVNPMDRVDNYAYYLDDSYAKVLFVEASLLPALESVLAARPWLNVVVVDGDAGPHTSFASLDAAHAGALPPPLDTHRDDMAFWLYSSGSTGRPKGVVHAHGDIGVTVNQYARNVLRISASDLCYSTTKLFHAYGLGNSLTFPLSVGACSALVKGRSTPDLIFQTLRRVHPTLFFSVPALYAAMVRTPAASEVDFSSVRACVSAAEALPAAVLARWQKLTGVPILDGIGSTEMLHIYCSNTFDDLMPGTSGRPVPGYALRLIDEHGLDVAAGEPGDLMVRGESCAAYYWHQRAKTRFSMRGEWFHTGDRYVVDSAGYFVYQGRSDDMIKVGGLWVSPADVEGCLVRHPAVSEAAVIGVRIEDVSRIKAFVIAASTAPADPDALADELRQWCKENLRRYEFPHVIEFVEDLPRTPTGKVQRYKLREAEEVQATLAGAA
ncbi:MAG: benzoate-CoA ligase family protein [Solirubrobacterales bacterium]|nr:benzoate-CoA ligase family protein [Solirubrobacterales bacterium]MBV9943158.1 benzoate-CoA ligase family protein [Solirubrobacterales bacterium]